jgi:hypothetical protein
VTVAQAGKKPASCIDGVDIPSVFNANKSSPSRLAKRGLSFTSRCGCGTFNLFWQSVLINFCRFFAVFCSAVSTAGKFFIP